MLQDTQAIFLGEASHRRKVAEWKIAIDFHVKAVWKGPIDTERLTLYIGDADLSCGADYSPGGMYLVYAFPGDDGELRGRGCVSRPLSSVLPWSLYRQARRALPYRIQPFETHDGQLPLHDVPVETLAAMFADEDPRRRRQAILALPARPDVLPAAVPQLERLLSSVPTQEAQYDRSLLLKTLKTLAPGDASPLVSTLAQRLDDPRMEVRLAAIQALAGVGSEASAA